MPLIHSLEKAYFKVFLEKKNTPKSVVTEDFLNYTITTFHQGGDRNMSYIVVDKETQHAIAIDGGLVPHFKSMTSFIHENQLKLKVIFSTHEHFDHCALNHQWKKLFSKADLIEFPMSTSQFKVGNLNLETIPTPGHTAKSTCLKLEKDLFTGDTLFVDRVGGTTGKNHAQIQFNSLQKLKLLSPDVRIRSGHHFGRIEHHTLAEAMKTNPFLKADSFDEFWNVKKNWKRIKRELEL